MTGLHVEDLIAVKPADRFDEAALGIHLARVLDGYRGPLSARQFKSAKGPATYLLHTAGRDYVLRRAAVGNAAAAERLAREFQVTASLAARGFPVLAALHHCADPAVIGAPFTIADHRRGRVWRDPRLPGLDPKERARLYEAIGALLAELHGLSPDDLGLNGTLAPETPYAARLAKWIQGYRDQADEDIGPMERLIAWLPDHLPRPDPASLTHGDCRIDNMLFDIHEPRVVALQGWDQVGLGQPLADVARLCALYHITVPGVGGLEGLDPIATGIPGERDFVGQYCGRLGRPVPDDWHVHVAIDLFRLAVVSQGVKRRAAAAGQAQAARQYGMLTRAYAGQAWHLVEGE